MESSPAKVGQQTRDWSDPHRTKWTEDGPRPLRTEIWYPARDSAMEEERWIGPPGQPLGAALTVLPGDVGHYAFLGEGTELGRNVVPLYACDPPSVDRAEVHRRTSSEARTFFDSRLGTAQDVPGA